MPFCQEFSYATLVRQLILYSTPVCHLCDDAKALIARLPIGSVRLEVVDITDDQALMRVYGLRIPVLKLEGADGDLRWPFDFEGLCRYVRV